MNGVYLYGIIEATKGAELSVAGIDDVSPVRIVAGKGLGCVVSDYFGGEFASLSKEQLVRSLFTHQWVVERVMQENTVLPVKFGTILDDPQEVLGLLSQGRSKLADALAAIRDKVEMEVAATWDTTHVLRDIAEEEEVRRAKEAIARKGPPTLEEQVQFGRMVKAFMDKRRNSYRERTVDLLRPLCVDLASNVLVSDELVMNVAFLLHQGREHEFDAQVQHLDLLFQNDLSFRVIGPLPPYSFSTVEVARLTPGQVREARQALYLTGGASQSEVRKAYRRLAAADQRAAGAGEGILGRLRQASQVLLRYGRAQEEARTGGGLQAPDREGASSLFEIAIKKSQGDQVEASRFGGAGQV